MNSCQTALCEVLYAADTPVRNIRRHKPDIALPPIPDVPHGQVSQYVIGFLVLKVYAHFIIFLPYVQFSFLTTSILLRYED